MKGLDTFVYRKARGSRPAGPGPDPTHDSMIKRVLICEDIDSINIGLSKTLSDAFSFDIDHSKDGDKALLMIKRAMMEKRPYDLLITDLSFNHPGAHSEIPDGESLLRAVKGLQPGLKRVIYSVEDRPHKIREYLENLHVNAYVLKGRESGLQMVEAIRAVQQDEYYLSPELSEILHLSSSLDIEEYDLLLLKSLSEGYSQQEIAKLFKKQRISPHSLSSIEKRVNRLKDSLSARNIPNLIAVSKDMGLI